MRSLAATVPALLLAGCEAASVPSANWQARLDSLPSPLCVQGALGAAPGLAVIGLEQEEGDGFTLDLRAEPGIAMRLRFARTDGDAAFFLSYADSARSRVASELAAKDIIFRLSGSCGLTELFWRARETDAPEPLLRIWAAG